MNKIKDLITPEQLENKPASIRIDFYNLAEIEVHFEGQFSDVIGLGADIYSALAEEVIEKELLDFIIFDRSEMLRLKYGHELPRQRRGFIDFKIDEKSNIAANINGNEIALAIGYQQFIENVCTKYDLSYKEYLELIKDNYESWKKSDKKRIFKEALKK